MLVTRWLPHWPDWAAHLHDHLRKIEGMLMTAQQDIDAIAAEIGTATDSIKSEIATLEEQVASGAAPDLTGLKAAVAGLEGVVPAPPVPAPVDVPPPADPTAAPTA